MRGLVTVPPGRVSVMGRPEVCRASRMSSTVASGTACLRSAKPPVTCGVAMEVPLSWPKVPPVSEERMSSPGASRDRKEAAFENQESSSALSVEPTLTADEMQPGDDSALVRPLLPAATIVAIPTERRLSMIGFSGSSSQVDENCPPPRLRFTEAKLYVLRKA